MILVLALLMATNADSDSFSSGLLEGLRKSTSTETTCYTQIIDLPDAYSNFLNSTTVSEDLHNFQKLTNDFTYTVKVCQFENLANQIYGLLEPANMQEFYLDALANLNELTSYYNSYTEALNNGDSYNEGWYAGKLFSALFGYYI